MGSYKYQVEVDECSYNTYDDRSENILAILSHRKASMKRQAVP